MVVTATPTIAPGFVVENLFDIILVIERAKVTAASLISVLLYLCRLYRLKWKFWRA